MRYRTIWISDVHLGTRQCDAEAVLTFLEHLDGELELVHRPPSVRAAAMAQEAAG